MKIHIWIKIVDKMSLVSMGVSIRSFSDLMEFIKMAHESCALFNYVKF